MALVESNGFAHVRITVTDVRRSRAFYDHVFGWEVAADESAHAGDDGIEDAPEKLYGGVVYQTPDGPLFGLRPVGSEGFDPDRTGLDHLSFSVASRDALVAARDALDAAGVEHGEIVDIEAQEMAILSFQDPDDINVELTAPLGT
jgi:glyoxylase I family protein